MLTRSKLTTEGSVPLTLFETVFEEFSQGEVGDSVFVPRGKQRCGADDVFRMVVADLLQWTELTLAGGLFRNDVTRLYINRFARFSADEIYLPSIQHAHLHFVAQMAQVFVNGIFDYLFDVGVHTSLGLEVTEAQVVPVDFLVGLEDFFAVDIEPGNDVEQECFGVKLPVKQDKVGRHIFPQRFHVFRDAVGRGELAGCVRVKSDEVVEKRDVADVVPLDDVLEHDSVEDAGEVGPHLLVAVESHFPQPRQSTVSQVGH